MKRYLVPLLLVPVVSLVLSAFRPQILTAGFVSWRAFAVTAGVGLAGLLALGLVWRRSRLGALWTADLVVLALMASVVWPVFRERTVVEDFPPVALASPSAPPAVPAPARTTARPAPPVTAPTTAPSPTPSRSAAPVTRRSAVPSPSVVATRLAGGSLRGIDHHARGGVALYEVDGRVLLRFERVDIEGTPTPSVHLVPPGRESPKGGIRLGGLKGEKGSFSYTAPSGFDPQRGWSVLVWCDRYAVPIAAADLA